MTSEIYRAVEVAFDKTKRAFERACGEAHAIFWNEYTLRMHFFRNLCEERVKIKRFFSEFSINLWGKKLVPDLVVHFGSNDEIIVAAFEFKFYSGGWKGDWEKIKTYLDEGFSHGFLIGIGTKSMANELPSRQERVDSKIARALIYEKERSEAFGHAPFFYIAEDLLKQTLDMPYTVNIILQLATTIPEDYAIAYTFHDKKCLLLGTFQKEEMWERIKKELADAGFENYLSLKVDEWNFKPTNEFEGIVLLDELPPNSYESTAKKAREALFRLKPVLAGLRPKLKLK